MLKAALPDKPFLNLSEALSWIAFGDTSNPDHYWGHYQSAAEKLAEAVEALVTAASTGNVALFGKYVSDQSLDADLVDTLPIPTEKLLDFRQYDLKHFGLRFGKGLLGFPQEREGKYVCDLPEVKRKAFYRDVVVDSQTLTHVFPPSRVGIKVSHEHVVDWCRDWMNSGKGTDGNKAWRTFKTLPQFEGLSREDCFRPAWGEAKSDLNQ